MSFFNAQIIQKFLGQPLKTIFFLNLFDADILFNYLYECRHIEIHKSQVFLNKASQVYTPEKPKTLEKHDTYS